MRQNWSTLQKVVREKPPEQPWEERMKEFRRLAKELNEASEEITSADERFEKATRSAASHLLHIEKILSAPTKAENSPER